MQTTFSRSWGADSKKLVQNWGQRPVVPPSEGSGKWAEPLLGYLHGARNLGGETLFKTLMVLWDNEAPGRGPHILGPLASGSVEIPWTISVVPTVNINVNHT